MATSVNHTDSTSVKKQPRISASSLQRRRLLYAKSQKLRRWGILQPSNFPSYFRDDEYWKGTSRKNSDKQSSTTTTSFEEVESIQSSLSSVGSMRSLQSSLSNSNSGDTNINGKQSGKTSLKNCVSSEKRQNKNSIESKQSTESKTHNKHKSNKESRRKRKDVDLVVPDDDDNDPYPFAKHTFNKKNGLKYGSSSSLGDLYLSHNSFMTNSSASTSTSLSTFDIPDIYQQRVTPSLSTRSASVDSSSSSLTSSPLEPFMNPQERSGPLPAEQVLANLGFCNIASLLPERFIRDWYHKVAISQSRCDGEDDGPNDISDFEDESNTSICSGLSSSTHPTSESISDPGEVNLSHMDMKPRFLNRSNTFSHFPSHSQTSAESEPDPDFVRHLRVLLDKQAHMLRSDKTNDREHERSLVHQLTLPLALDPLTEEDESRQSSASICNYNVLHEQIIDEENLSSSNTSSDSPCNAEEDGNKCRTVTYESDSRRPSQTIPSIIISGKSIDGRKPLSAESLELADINRNIDATLKGHSSATSQSIQNKLGIGRVSSSNLLQITSQQSPLSDDRLSPFAPSSASSRSPSAVSPVTVIEVGSDHPNELSDYDDRSKKSIPLLTTDIGSTIDDGRLSPLISSAHQTNGFHVITDASQDTYEVSCQTSDRSLSPIEKFSNNTVTAIHDPVHNTLVNTRNALTNNSQVPQNPNLLEANDDDELLHAFSRPSSQGSGAKHNRNLLSPNCIRGRSPNSLHVSPVYSRQNSSHTSHSSLNSTRVHCSHYSHIPSPSDVFYNDTTPDSRAVSYRGDSSCQACCHADMQNNQHLRRSFHSPNEHICNVNRATQLCSCLNKYQDKFVHRCPRQKTVEISPRERHSSGFVSHNGVISCGDRTSCIKNCRHGAVYIMMSCSRNHSPDHVNNNHSQHSHCHCER